MSKSSQRRINHSSQVQKASCWQQHVQHVLKPPKCSVICSFPHLSENNVNNGHRYLMFDSIVFRHFGVSWFWKRQEWIYFTLPFDRHFQIHVSSMTNSSSKLSLCWYRFIALITPLYNKKAKLHQHLEIVSWIHIRRDTHLVPKGPNWGNTIFQLVSDEKQQHCL